MYRKQNNRLILTGLWIVLAVGFILRMYRLGGRAVWFDEACSFAYVQQNWTAFLRDYFNYKPFYFAILKIWTGIFGVSAFAGRFLSVIFAMLSIYLIYEVGKKLFSKEVGLFSAFFLAISCFHVYHSQQVRQISLITFLWLISYLLCTKIFFENKTGKKLIFLNSFVNILSIYTHPYGLALVVCQNVFFILQRKKISRPGKNWYYGQTVILLFLVLWILIPNQQSHIKEMIWWIPKNTPALFLETWETFCFGGPRYGLDDFIIRVPYLYVWGYILLPVYIWLFLSAIMPFKRNNAEFQNERPKKIFLLVWLFCPISLAILLSLFRPVYVIKHFLYVLPAFYILVALGLSRFREGKFKIAFLLMITVSSIFPLQVMYANDFNIDWRTPARHIRNNMGEKDTIIICNLAEVVPFLYHFNGHDPDPLRGVGVYGKKIDGRWQSLFYSDDHCIMGIEGDMNHDSERMFEDFEYKAGLNRYGWLNNNIWFASSRWSKEDLVNHINSFLLNKGFKLESRVPFNGVEVFYFLNNRTGRSLTGSVGNEVKK